jgi:uncharacterized membrane protein YoaK (UPF0700 family)
MSEMTGSAQPVRFDLAELRRAAAVSIRHPLARTLLLLTFTAGLVDAVSYLALGHVFTANMTGNIVFLGFGIAGSGGLPVVAPLVSLAAFLVGASGGGALARRTGGRHLKHVTSALGFEASLIGAATVLAAEIDLHPGTVSAYIVIALLAVAMGLRSATVRRIGVADLTTIVLTMTLSALAADSPLAGGSGGGSSRRVAAVAAMLGGALAGALLLKVSAAVPLAVAAGLGLLAAVLYPAAARRGSSAARGNRNERA